jgi:hypothetical protein
MPTKAECEANRMQSTLVRYLQFVKYPQHLRGAPGMTKVIERGDAMKLAKRHKVEIIDVEEEN